MTNILHRTKSLDKPARPNDERLKPLPFLPVNRNLRSWPLARGERSNIEWRRKPKAGYRYYALPNVEVRLPLDCGFKRHATGFDVAVLLTVTGIAKARRRAGIWITNTEILAHLGLPRSGYNLNKVASALLFWQHATMVWSRWYMSKDQIGRLAIKRPIASASRGRIKLSEKWLKLTDRFFAQIPGPLPTEAVVQNLLLLVLGWRKARMEDYRGVPCALKSFRSRRQITRRIGLDHCGRNHQLTLAIEKLKAWCEDRGGAMVLTEYENGSIEFLYQVLVPPRRKAER